MLHSFLIPEGAAIDVAVRAIENQVHPAAIFLAPMALEAYKEDLCPDSRYLSDIVHIKTGHTPVLLLRSADMALEGHVYWRTP